MSRKPLPGSLYGSAIIGGLLGIAAVYLVKNGLLSLPAPKNIFGTGTYTDYIVGAVLGIIIGGVIGGLANFVKPSAAAKIELREERLDINRKRIQTGNVKMHKEIVTEEKTVNVPVTREELVIEKKLNDGTGPETNKTIRIPLREEQIEIDKRQVDLNDVSVYKREYQENEHVAETLKKEKLIVETSGNPEIKESDE